MSGDFLASSALSWQDYGLVGLVVGFVLTGASGLIWWSVKGMRSDMRRTLQQSEVGQAAFLSYVIETAGKQTETLVAVANQLSATARQAEKHEEHANARHTKVMEALARLNGATVRGGR